MIRGGDQPDDPDSYGKTMESHTQTVTDNANSVGSKGADVTPAGALGTHVKYTHKELPTASSHDFATNHPPPGQAGGASSDWRGTNYSRGPVNYPRNGWNNGEQMFKQFSKNATYIPNDKLAHNVAPISTGLIREKTPVGSSISGSANSYANY